MVQWFEHLSQYQEASPIPPWMQQEEHLSLIRVYGDGKTQPGWGENQFMTNYRHNAFDPQRALRFYNKYYQPFAFVMRSVRYLCVDVDGKNGGIQTAAALHLTRTAAEISKSGEGFHIFYDVPGTIWDEAKGYNEFPDFNGLIPGVDIRGTGVVYHHHNQRWNNEPPAPIPASLATLIGRARDIKQMARATRVSNIDPSDLVILHDMLLDELKRPIRRGTRNNDLYRIGCRMYMAGLPNWAGHIMTRGLALGLEEGELYEIITNIEKYA